MSLPPNSPRRPLPTIPAPTDAPPPLPARTTGMANGVPAITTTATTTTTNPTYTTSTVNSTSISASPSSPRLRNVSISPRPKPQSMRNLMVEKSPGSLTEKFDAPELKTRKPHMTVPALSLPDSSVASPFGQTSSIHSKIGSLSPRNTPKSTRSQFYDNSPRALSPRPHPDDKIFSVKDVQPFPLRSELFSSSKSDLKKSISALATLLMQQIENQIRHSLELKLANTPDPTQDGEGSQGVLSEQMIKALGRMDHPVMANDLPPALEYLNPSPEKSTVRFEQLLQGLFSGLIKDKGINTLVDLKKMQALINHGDLKIAVGENDPKIREKIMTSFQPYADQLTNEIFGKDKKLEDCMLPEELIKGVSGILCKRVFLLAYSIRSSN